jgi:[ribosomal protein S18]-alanine N-acetyltransferase
VTRPLYTIVPMDESAARAIVEWHYPPPYDFYDALPEETAEILSDSFRAGRFFAAIDASGELAGFFEFKHERVPLEVGLGMRPDLTGQGRGVEFVRAGMEFARDQFGASDLMLAVADFNLRAIAVYQRAGFVETGEYQHQIGEREYRFLTMAAVLA